MALYIHYIMLILLLILLLLLFLLLLLLLYIIITIAATTIYYRTSVNPALPSQIFTIIVIDHISVYYHDSCVEKREGSIP